MTTHTQEAERLMYWAPPIKDDPSGYDDFALAVREALAAERRATVERIVEKVAFHLPLESVAVSVIRHALGEEAG